MRFGLLALAIGCAIPAPARAIPNAPTTTVTRMAITVDDLPVHGPLPVGASRLSIAKKMLAAFDKQHLKGV